jgi:hypothetical protein
VSQCTDCQKYGSTVSQCTDCQKYGSTVSQCTDCQKAHDAPKTCVTASVLRILLFWDVAQVNVTRWFEGTYRPEGRATKPAAKHPKAPDRLSCSAPFVELAVLVTTCCKMRIDRQTDMQQRHQLYTQES